MSGKKTGFLSEVRRNYLKISQQERMNTFSDKQINQYDTAIQEQAVLALQDITLIVRECNKETLKNIFSKEAITEFLDILMDRIGMDEVENGELYYEIPLRAIEHRIRDKYLEHQRFFKLEESEYPLLPSKPAYKDIKEYMRK